MSTLAPVGGAESQDGEGQSQTGQRQGEQGARATRHTLQHGQTGGEGGRGRPDRERAEGNSEEKREQIGGVEGDNARGNKTNVTEGVTTVTDGAGRVGQML